MTTQASAPPLPVRAFARPAPIAGAIFAAALAFFIGFEAIHIARSGYWTDELFSLWAGDPRQSLGDALTQRILKDTNPPLYFSLIFLMRHIFWNGREAILWVNGLGLSALLGLTIWIGWRARMTAAALLVGAFFLLGAPALCYAPEGRCYALAMATALALAVLAATKLEGPAPLGLDFILAAALAALATWLHLYGAIFSGALGAALIAVGWLIAKRRDLVKLGFTIGLAAVAAFAVWLAIAAPMFARTAQAGFWLPFTPAAIKEAFWTAKQYSIGPTLAAPIGAAFIAASLWRAESRATAALAAMTGAGFVLIPFLVSFHTVIFLGRYMLVGAPALLALTIFTLRIHILAAAREAGFGRSRAIAALGALFLAAPLASGAATADWHFKNRWDWLGIDEIAPLARQCPDGHIRVLNSSIRNLSGFEYLLKGRLEPVNAAAAPLRDIAAIDCPVYGWAEHYLAQNDDRDWAARADVATALAAFHLTNNAHIPLRIDRHPGGLVLRRAAP